MYARKLENSGTHQIRDGALRQRWSSTEQLCVCEREREGVSERERARACQLGQEERAPAITCYTNEQVVAGAITSNNLFDHAGRAIRTLASVYLPLSRNSAHTRQSRPDAGLRFQEKVVHTFNAVPSSPSSGFDESLCPPLRPEVLTVTTLAGARKTVDAFGARKTVNALVFRHTSQ